MRRASVRQSVRAGWIGIALRDDEAAAASCRPRASYPQREFEETPPGLCRSLAGALAAQREAAPRVWEQFVSAQQEGLARAIGVSNYSLRQIDELIKATGVTPQVNQIRWGPPLYDPSMVAGLEQRGVVLEGYSPFKVTDLRDQTLVSIAQEHDATTTQVIVAWHIAHGFVVIPSPYAANVSSPTPKGPYQPDCRRGDRDRRAVEALAIQPSQRNRGRAGPAADQRGRRRPDSCRHSRTG